MLAYKNDEKLKEMYVQRAVAHREADQLVQGYGYWKNGKGCAIGCLAHADKNAHQVLENDAGLPTSLNHLADHLFENLPSDKYRVWPERYAAAPKVGADLSLVSARFMVWLLTEEVVKHFDATAFPEVAACCATVSTLYRRKIAGEEIVDKEWIAAARAARAAAADAAPDAAARAADAAARATYAAAYAAVDAAARAARAAYAAVYAAARAAYAAARAVDAVDAAVYAAVYAAACAADAAARAAACAAYERMADKLIELMQEA